MYYRYVIYCILHITYIMSMGGDTEVSENESVSI